MNRRATLLAVAEVSLWWAALAAPWPVFGSTLDLLELAVGANAVLLGAPRPGPRDGR